MDGITLAKICDIECQKRGISKAQFYKDIGVSAPSFHGWKNGAKPSDKYVVAIEKYFGISLNDIEKSEMDDETAQILQNIRERYDYRAVCKSAIGLSPSQAFEVAAFIERLKEGNEVVTSD